MVAVRIDSRLQARIDPSDVVQESLMVAARKLPGYKKAIEELMSSEAIDSEPILQLGLAIAHHHADHRTDASAWLEKAQHLLKDWDAENANARIESEVLRHEAERLILGENHNPPELTPAITGQARSVTGSR